MARFTRSVYAVAVAVRGFPEPRKICEARNTPSYTMYAIEGTLRRVASGEKEQPGDTIHHRRIDVWPRRRGGGTEHPARQHPRKRRLVHGTRKLLGQPRGQGS